MIDKKTAFVVIAYLVKFFDAHHVVGVIARVVHYIKFVDTAGYRCNAGSIFVHGTDIIVVTVAVVIKTCYAFPELVCASYIFFCFSKASVSALSDCIVCKNTIGRTDKCVARLCLPQGPSCGIFARLVSVTLVDQK